MSALQSPKVHPNGLPDECETCVHLFKMYFLPLGIGKKVVTHYSPAEAGS